MPSEDGDIRKYVGPLSIGLYYDRAPIFAPEGSLQDCLNVRIQNGRITNDSIGWKSFNGIVLDGEVTLCDSFRFQGGSETLFGTRTTLYRFDPVLLTVATLNPLYSTGTAGVAGGTLVVGIGTFWNTAAHASNASWPRAVQAGDWFRWGTANEDDPNLSTNGGWAQIASVASDTSMTLATSVGAHAQGSYTIRKSFSGATDEIWQWALFPVKDADGKDYLYLTNGAQFVRWDPEINATQVLLSTGFTPRGLSVFERSLIAFDITDNVTGKRTPGKVRISAIGDPDNWTTLEAVEAFATDGHERIAVARPLGEYLLLYCDESARIAAFVGPPVFWAFRTALPGVGIIGRNAIMDFGDHHEFISQDTIYSFDGAQNLSIAPHVFRQILKTIDVGRLWQVLSLRDKERGEVNWIVPDVGDAQDSGPAYAWIEHYLEVLSSGALLPVTKRQLPATAVGSYIAEQSMRFSDFTDGFDQHHVPFNARQFGGIYPTLIFGTAYGEIHQLNITQTDAVDEILPSWAELSTRPAIGDGLYAGLVQRIEPYLEKSSGNVSIELFGQERLGGDKVLLDSSDYALDGSGRRFTSPRHETRFASIRVRSGESSPWALGALATTIVPGGTR